MYQRSPPFKDKKRNLPFKEWKCFVFDKSDTVSKPTKQVCIYLFEKLNLIKQERLHSKNHERIILFSSFIVVKLTCFGHTHIPQLFTHFPIFIRGNPLIFAYTLTQTGQTVISGCGLGISTWRIMP